MPFVERRGGRIVGVYANMQPGYAEEFLDDNDVEVLAYTAPPAPLPDLQPFQFWSVLELSGHKAGLDSFINGLQGQAKIVARAKLEKATTFRRSNSLVEAARVALGLTPAELDALWLQAAAIT